MNSLLKRTVTVVASAVLATSAFVAPAMAMDANYTCSSGSRILISDLVGYVIVASGCTGSGTDTYGTITIPSGSYFCQRVTYSPAISFVNGQRC
ncbi:hypothetical protein ACFFV7_34160 [Nonomuraea spiralis]|uniref:Secreted protein n=1 Tax=Nonomuraea spiralis TaxID=46182 RepID=A0ABV5IP08_9ACTN|nr:hypothetical protein [Nonomuraea spiralis]GGT26910.1 hypothetical protein GCM10010176_084490 [Nonomuraea spiralis]